MGSNKLVCALICLTLLLFQQPAAFADAIVYTPPGKASTGALTGKLPLARVGNLLLPRGLVSLSGDEMKILAVPQWLFDRTVVLQGAMIRAEVASQPNGAVIAGLVYFYAGTWLNELGHQGTHEVIETLDGVEHSGTVTGRALTSLTLKTSGGATESIPFTSIKSINSPHAFAFNIPTATKVVNIGEETASFDSNLITLRQTRIPTALVRKGAAVPISKLPGTEPGISKGAIAVFLALDMIVEAAPVIVTPLVLNKNTQRPAERATYNTVLQSGIQPDVPSAYNPTPYH